MTFKANHRCCLFSSIFSALLVVGFFATLVGCGFGVLVGGDVQQFSSDYSIALETPKAGILDVIADVGKSIGYRVSSMSRGIIQLESKSSFMDKQLGKIGGSTIISTPRQ